MIEILTAVQGESFPTNGTDTLGGVYCAWAVDDAGQVSISIPDDYQPGTDITLEINETTPGQSKDHKWEVTCRLNNGIPQTFSTEFVSDPVVNTVTPRSIVASGSGQISSILIAPEALFTIILRRVTADSNEDSNSIKLYTLEIGYTASATSGIFPGRLGAIVDDVLDMFNDRREEFITGTDVLRWTNKCTLEIASRGYFKTSELIDLTAGDGDIDLSTAFSDHSEILNLFWEAFKTEIKPLSTFHELEAVRRKYPTGSVTLGYYVQSNILYLAPVPSISATGAIRVWRNNIPAPMTGLLGSCTPPVPEDRDKVYFYSCMQRAHMKDRHGTDSASNAAVYNGLFEKEMNKLMGQNTTPNFQFRPYR